MYYSWMSDNGCNISALLGNTHHFRSVFVFVSKGDPLTFFSRRIIYVCFVFYPGFIFLLEKGVKHKHDEKYGHILQGDERDLFVIVLFVSFCVEKSAQIAAQSNKACASTCELITFIEILQE